MAHHADEDVLSKSLRTLLAGLCVCLIVLLGVVAWRESQCEWRARQKESRAMALAEAQTIYNQLANSGTEIGILKGAQANVNRLQQEPDRIQQVWLPSFGRIDRCTTCHASDLLQTSGSAHSDHAFERFGCTLCHGGVGRATTSNAAHVGLWRGNWIEAACGRCHAGPEVLGAPVLSTGRRLLASSGCAGCHTISEFAGEPPVGNSLAGLADRVRPEWLVNWLQAPVAASGSADWLLTWVRHRPAYLAARMPDYVLTPDEARLLAAYLFNLPNDVSTPIEADALPGDPARGGQAFKDLGCPTCHRLGEQNDVVSLGADLTTVGDKLLPNALKAWLETPQTVLRNSRMPRFRLTAIERADLAAFLADQHGVPLTSVTLPSQLSAEETEQAKRLVEALNCIGCHEIPGMAPLPPPGPDLSSIGDRWPEQLDFGRVTAPPEAMLADWLTLKLNDPRAFSPELQMPNFHFSSAEVDALVTALLSLSAEEMPADALVAYEPPTEIRWGGRLGALDAEARCTGCHRLGNDGGNVGPDLQWLGSKLQPDWLREYLIRPEVVRPLLQARMPRLGLSDDQVATVLTYADIALRNPAVVPVEPFTAEETREGQALFETRPCLTCHSFGDAGEVSAPNLAAVHQRLTPEWVVAWLHDPRALDARTEMPNFQLSEQDIRALAAYLFGWQSVLGRQHNGCGVDTTLLRYASDYATSGPGLPGGVC